MSRLDDAVRRVLRIKFRLGLFENPYGGFNRQAPPLSRDFARKFAASCMVLLKNESSILPLPKENINIAVIGPYANERRPHLGTWMLDGKPEDVVTILEGIRQAAPTANIITPASNLLDDMYTAARKADYVIAVLGESHDRTGEARSVANIDLSPDQLKLLEEIRRFNQNIIAVICAGRPLALEDSSTHAKAVLYAWHSGIEAGNAAADILFGEVNPTAKLPVTFPRCTGQIPIYYNHRQSCRNIDEYYGEPDEFNNYQDSPGSPLYPFGHGLQYTAYSYDKIRTERVGESIQVSVDITNTGKRQGTETAQCYIRAHHASMVRPMCELVAFKQISLDAGQKETVVFSLTPREMSFYNAKGQLVFEPGEFTVWVGGSSQTGPSARFTIKS